MRFLWVPGEVINGQYRPYIEATGTKPALWGDPEYNQPQQPVAGVSWHAAATHCGWLTSKLGGRAVARLPSEAWWERAARGDDGRRYPWGNEPPDERRAWLRPSCGRTAQAARKYAAGLGPYGHLELAGNVWEWCSDGWDGAACRKPPHSAPEPLDPESTGGDGERRPVRGGSFWVLPGLASGRVPSRELGRPQGPESWLPGVSRPPGAPGVRGPEASDRAFVISPV